MAHALRPAGRLPPPCLPPSGRGTCDVPSGRPRPPAASLLCTAARLVCAAALLLAAAAPLLATAATAAAAGLFQLKPAGEPGFAARGSEGFTHLQDVQCYVCSIPAADRLACSSCCVPCSGRHGAAPLAVTSNSPSLEPPVHKPCCSWLTPSGCPSAGAPGRLAGRLTA